MNVLVLFFEPPIFSTFTKCEQTYEVNDGILMAILSSVLANNNNMMELKKYLVFLNQTICAKSKIYSPNYLKMPTFIDLLIPPPVLFCYPV